MISSQRASPWRTFANVAAMMGSLMVLAVRTRSFSRQPKDAPVERLRA